ncbi:MAG: hypothetical protein KIT86_05615 [Hydrogenophaga sp.]|uniref:hypothetical protein n=1 Tax=Hydrogenophaga sp. TaxID=1904254 RepID=UPI0026095783|nr:hypothetical protein [Hydrogenophaga sp.]MCW5669118.1 hypothetical protein [Hydrogenophaga sp.]
MLQKTPAPGRKRVPNGVNSSRPIALRLTPAELQRVKERANLEQRSMASICRMAVLRELGMNDQGAA